MIDLPENAAELLKRLRVGRKLATQTDSTDSASATTIETTLALAWAEVLGVPDVQLDDNIFDLGGDSLHLVQITARIREIYNVEITFGELFDAPTILELGPIVKRHLETSLCETPDNAS